jgi:hypothetical protein
VPLGKQTEAEQSNMLLMHTSKEILGSKKNNFFSVTERNEYNKKILRWYSMKDMKICEGFWH